MFSIFLPTKTKPKVIIKRKDEFKNVRNQDCEHTGLIQKSRVLHILNKVYTTHHLHVSILTLASILDTLQTYFLCH